VSDNPHYSAEVWRRFRAPRHAGALSGAGSTQGEARTPASKAVLRLQLKLHAGRIQAARFQALGCPSTIAAGDWLCEWLEGRALAEAAVPCASRLSEALALSPVRRHCAVLAEDALRAALSNMGKGKNEV
jgi:NifU-like protein involved in Fe-S cluster formation